MHSRSQISAARAGIAHCLIVHGAGVVLDGSAYLFLAKSGGGKSTIASICLSRGGTVLGDDTVMILEKPGGFFLRPGGRRQMQAGAVALPVGDETRLRSCFFLAKARAPSLQRVTPVRAVEHSIREWSVRGFTLMEPSERLVVLDRMLRLFRDVPTYQLRFAVDARFVELIHKTHGPNEPRGTGR